MLSTYKARLAQLSSKHMKDAAHDAVVSLSEHPASQLPCPADCVRAAFHAYARKLLLEQLRNLHISAPAIARGAGGVRTLVWRAASPHHGDQVGGRDERGGRTLT